MGRADPLPQPLSLEQYLERERLAEHRSEFHAGEVFAMAGASIAHITIVASLVEGLRPCLKKKGCWLGSTDLRVYVPAADAVFYPDVAVVCGAMKFYNARRDVLLNPTAVVEVLSPSTRDYDLGTKFERYRSVESLTEYVVVDSARRWVERWHRAGGTWHLDPDSSRLLLADCSLTLEAVYEGVEFDATDGASAEVGGAPADA